MVDGEIVLPTLSESGVTSGSTDLPSLSSLLSLGKGTDLSLAASKSPSAEGIPPIATRLLEIIRRWDYVDLSDLLSESAGKHPEISAPQNQVILVQSLDQMRRKRKQISDIESWLQAFSMYAAALAAEPSTTKEESTGLFAHMYLITQIAKDLGGLTWYKYDREFRERAAATNTRVWGTLNLSIYGRCLAMPQPPATIPNDCPAWRNRPEKKGRPGKQKNKACFKYNLEISCGRSEVDCFYDHVCWHCGAKEHTADACPAGPKHQKRRREERDCR